MKWMEELSKEVKLIVGAVLTLVTFGGFLFGLHDYLETKYASAESVKQLGQGFQYHLKSEQQRSIQERIWKIEERYQGKPINDPTVREEYRKLQEDKKNVDEQLRIMERGEKK